MSILLLVEDEVITARVEKKELESYGYSVTHVTTGEEAYRYIVTEGRPADLILMDIDLGDGIDGTQAAQQILAERDIPLLFLSSHTEPEIVEKTEIITSYGYVVKRSGITVLDASIKMAFKLHDAKVREKEKELRLNESEKIYRSFVESFPNGALFLFDENYTYRAAGGKGLAPAGLTSDSVTGKTIQEVFPELWDTLKPHCDTALGGSETYYEIEYHNRIYSNQALPLHTSLNGSNERLAIVVTQDITGRRQLEERLLESEHRYRSIFSNNHSAMLIIDPATGAIIDANLAAENFYGWSYTELTSKRIQEINSLSDDKVREEMAQARTENRSFFRFKHLLANGDIRDVEVHSGPIIVNRKEYLYSIIHDLTDIYQAENEKLSLYEASRAVIECHTFEDAARKIFDICCKATGAISGYVALLSKSGEENEVLFLESGGLPCSVDPSLPMPVRGLREQAYISGNVVFENNFMESQWVQYMPEGHVEMKNVLFAPLVIGQRVAGVIGIANKPVGFNDDDAHIIRSLADIAAIALERSINEETLSKSEALLNETGALARVGGWEYDLRTKVLKWTHTTRVIHEVPPDYEPTLEEAFSFYSEDSQKLLTEHFNRAIESGEDFDMEMDFITARKNLLIVRGIGHAEFINDNCVRVYGVFQDITKQKQIEESHNNHQQFIQHLIDTVPGYMSYVDREFHYRYVNKGYMNLFDVVRDEIIHKPVKTILDGEAYSRALPNMHKALQGQQVTFENIVLDKKKYPKTIHTTYTPYYIKDAIVGFFVMAVDISDRKEMELALEKSEKKFRAYIENANDIIFNLTPEGVFEYVSPNWHDILGHALDEVTGHPFAPFVHPDDVHYCEAFLQKVLTTGEKQRGVEYRVLHKDGHYRWHSSNGAPIKDSDGKIVSFVGIARDITDNKEAQQENRSLLNELNHRIKNTFSMIIGLIELNRDAVTDEKARNLMHEISTRVHTMAHLYSLLQQDTPASEINLCEYFYSIVSTIKDGYCTDETNIDFSMECDEVRTDIRVASSLGLLLNEAITNSVKYAFPDTKTGAITVASRVENDHITLEISDNGIGLPDGFEIEKSDGLGMLIIQGMVAQIDGTLELACHNGTMLKVTVPVNQKKEYKNSDSSTYPLS